MMRSHFLLISLLGVWSTSVLSQPTWSALGPEAGDVTAVVVDPRTPDRLLAGTTQGGVYRSANGGLTWALASSGLAANQVSVLLADPSMASTFWAATDLGLFKTTTNGDAWVEVDGLEGRREVAGRLGLRQRQNHSAGPLVRAMSRAYASPDGVVGVGPLRVPEIVDGACERQRRAPRSSQSHARRR